MRSYSGNIFFTGMPGSGKTSAGKKLAARINWSFIDLDSFIEEKSKKTIQKIFKEDGEKIFRNTESKHLNEIALTKFNHVISLGGGSICDESNLAILKKSGTVIYLRMTPEALQSRILQNPDSRPLFQGLKNHEILDKLRYLLNQREKYYIQSDLVLDALHFNLEELIQELKSFLKISRL